MKANDKKELKSKTKDELMKDLIDAKAEVSKMLIEAKTGKITNTNLVRQKRKDIARILTFIGLKEKGGTGKGKEVTA